MLPEREKQCFVLTFETIVRTWLFLDAATTITPDTRLFENHYLRTRDFIYVTINRCLSIWYGSKRKE